MAITMIVNQTRRLLKDKSHRHNAELERLGKEVEEEPLSANIILMERTPQLKGMATILRNANTPQVDFVFYLDRLTSLLVEKALDCHNFISVKVKTPQNYTYNGLRSAGTVSAVVVLRGGSCMETGLKRTLPDCLTGRILIQSNYRTAEPELHYLKLFPDISTHKTVLLLDPQMSSGGAALMAVKVLIDHGVAEKKIVFVTCLAGKTGANRLMSVFPDVKVVAANIVDDKEKRWIEERYLGC
jgi:uridine kinase